MEFMPFTLDEAREISDDFGDLVDTEFHAGPSVFLVVNIVVGPFGENDRVRFIENFLQTKDENLSIDFYTGSDYDVILVASDLFENYSFVDIRTFAGEKGITYHFPEREI